MWKASALFFLSAVGTASPVPNPTNLTLFHVNEASYTGIANMDTGDEYGDAFFALRSVFLPIECSNTNAHHYAGDCANPEVVGANLTVTEVIVEVDSNFGNYSECNVCVNSTVPFTKDTPCKNGDYVCVCGVDFRNLTTHCPPTVGREDVASVFNRFKPSIFSPKYEWWLHNLVDRVKGLWYSTPATGECTAAAPSTSSSPSSPTAACHWRLLESKRRVLKSCQMGYVFKQVTTKNPSCFNKCSQPSNTTSTCYIECFYDTLLGKNSGGRNPTGGMTRDEIADMWAFPVRNDETKGGCPEYNP